MYSVTNMRFHQTILANDFVDFAFVFNFLIDQSPLVLHTLSGLRASRHGGLIVTASGEEGASCAERLRRPGGPVWTTLVPRLPEYGSAHSKFALMFYGAKGSYGE